MYQAGEGGLIQRQLFCSCIRGSLPAASNTHSRSSLQRAQQKYVVCTVVHYVQSTTVASSQQPAANRAERKMSHFGLVQTSLLQTAITNSGQGQVATNDM